MRAPLIGITTTRRTSEYGYPVLGIAEAYVSALVRAGAAPVLVPLGLPDDLLASLISRLDGVLFSGGGDVHPQRYNGAQSPLVNSIDADRDRVEIELIQQAAGNGLPFLGICRGLQVINVALGGDLYADIRAEVPQALRHDRFPEKPRGHLAHPVELAEGSRLRTILGADQAQVNSLHHQGIRRLAGDLHPAAYAPDGLVEAFELPASPFGLAVQWHPEELQEDPDMRHLFQVFIHACQEANADLTQRR